MINTQPVLCHLNLATGFRGGERQTYLLMDRLSNQGWQQKLIVRKAGKLAQLSESIANLRIIEVGLIVTEDNGDIISEYSSLVKPDNFTSLTSKVKELTHLSDNIMV